MFLQNSKKTISKISNKNQLDARPAGNKGRLSTSSSSAPADMVKTKKKETDITEVIKSFLLGTNILQHCLQEKKVTTGTDPKEMASQLKK